MSRNAELAGAFFAFGSVVADPFGRKGIVCSSESPPSEEWIDQQVKAEEIRRLGDVDWWGVMPFGGGYTLWSGPLLEYLRPSSYEDFLSVVDTASVAGRKKLAKLFPEYASRLLGGASR